MRNRDIDVDPDGELLDDEYAYIESFVNDGVAVSFGGSAVQQNIYR